ncbi:MAG: hypothetical protein OMM_13562, partial [Candidatus Magnetoglobus multicellularis str. Araruama]
SFWSSTPCKYISGSSWTVNFNLGGNMYKGRSSNFFVRAVRGGQHQTPDNLIITSPQQASKCQPGNNLNIKWFTKNISENIKISISREGGKPGTFIPIINNTLNDGEYGWKITQPPSVNCMLKIVPINTSEKGTIQGLFSIINTPPVADNNTFHIKNNQTFKGQLYATDANTDTLSYTIVNHPKKGVVIISDFSTGEYTYTPDCMQSGMDSFEFKVNDGFDDSNIAEISIFITALNSTPVAYDQNITLDEDKYVYINLKVIAPDNDTLIYCISDPPGNGNVTIIDNIALYIPEVNYNGPDRFTFKAIDGHCDTNEGIIMLTIYNVYDPPIATSQTLTITENMPTNITLTGFSPDNKELNFIILEQSPHCILYQTTSNLTYTPDDHFYGTDTFSFITNDGISDSSPATITIIVERA